MVPSLHVTCTTARSVVAGALAALVAALSTPPWPEQAPRPVEPDVVPSLQIVFSVPCADPTRSGAPIPIASNARITEHRDTNSRIIVEFLQTRLCLSRITSDLCRNDARGLGSDGFST